jgi:hypothetical protein
MLLNFLTGMSEVCLLEYRAMQLTKIYHCFEDPCCAHLQNNGIMYDEDGRAKFLKNFGKFLQDL